MSDRYVIVIEEGEANLGAYAPDLPGCVATGSTVEETIKRIREALWLHLDAMRRDGDPIPPATTKLSDPVDHAETAIGMVEVTPLPLERPAAA